MNKVIKMGFVLFLGLLITGCAMPAGGMMKERVSSYNTDSTQVVYSNQVSQEFIDGVGDMALGLLTSDAIAKASTPPLIVIRPLETEGEVPFDTAKYAEAERSLLIGKAGDKVRFIDKETTVEANYYLYGVISIAAAATPPSNTPGRRRYSTQSATNYLQQAAKSNQETTSDNRAYKFTMMLVDPHANATLWKDECGFTPTEMPQTSPKKKRSK
ncbi:MAG: hypothetical protein HZA49_02715 [Planctomycetes bacterium]|nr:hypothetical protein [Planctomycetota bacterium]